MKDRGERCALDARLDFVVGQRGVGEYLDLDGVRDVGGDLGPVREAHGVGREGRGGAGARGERVDRGIAVLPCGRSSLRLR